MYRSDLLGSVSLMPVHLLDVSLLGMRRFTYEAVDSKSCFAACGLGEKKFACEIIDRTT